VLKVLDAAPARVNVQIRIAVRSPRSKVRQDVARIVTDARGGRIERDGAVAIGPAPMACTMFFPFAASQQASRGRSGCRGKCAGCRCCCRRSNHARPRCSDTSRLLRMKVGNALSLLRRSCSAVRRSGSWFSALLRSMKPCSKKRRKPATSRRWSADTDRLRVGRRSHHVASPSNVQIVRQKIPSA